MQAWDQLQDFSRITINFRSLDILGIFQIIFKGELRSSISGNLTSVEWIFEDGPYALTIEGVADFSLFHGYVVWVHEDEKGPENRLEGLQHFCSGRPRSHGNSYFLHRDHISMV